MAVAGYEVMSLTNSILRVLLMRSELKRNLTVVCVNLATLLLPMDMCRVVTAGRGSSNLGWAFRASLSLA